MPGYCRWSDRPFHRVFFNFSAATLLLIAAAKLHSSTGPALHHLDRPQGSSKKIKSFIDVFSLLV